MAEELSLDYEFSQNLNTEDYEKLLKMIDPLKFKDTEFCLTIVSILKGYSTTKLDLFEAWETICLGSNIFNKEGCKNFWDKLKKEKKSNNNLIKLLDIVKLDCNEEVKQQQFNDIINTFYVKNIISNNKDNFPNNKLHIDKIISDQDYYHVKLFDKFCPIFNNNHENRELYIEVHKPGFMVLKCKCPLCEGKKYPINNVQLSKNQLNLIFNFNINNTTNNFYGPVENDIFNEDLTAGYKVFEDEEKNTLFLNSFSCTDVQISNFVFYLAKDNFFCCDNTWYEFLNHKWKITDNINVFIPDYVIENYRNFAKCLKKKNTTDSKNLIELTKRVIRILESETSINKIIKRTKYKFHALDSYNTNGSFINSLNTKAYLIGFDNGVYDLGKKLFRPGRKEDMISMSVNYDFPKEYSENKENLINFLEEILPIDEDREYFLKYLSTALIGLNECELFTILTGSGRNGKSKLIELIGLTFGDYFGNPKCKLLTGSRPDENSPEPGLLSLRKKKIIICVEPEKGDKLNSGFLKFITGNDKQNLRECHKNEMISFKANFATMMVCNDIPGCDDIDNALIKRLRCINFPTEFVKHPKESHQKKINVKLQENLINWKEDFILLLLEYYQKYIDEDLEPPLNVLKWTNSYKINSDIYLAFLSDYTEYSETHLPCVKLYDAFKNWHSINFPSDKIPSKTIFIAKINPHKKYEKTVSVNGSKTTGFKNIKLNIQ